MPAGDPYRRESEDRSEMTERTGGDVVVDVLAGTSKPPKAS